MILCIQCDATLKRLMDALVEKGGYEDYSELIAIAVTNLDAMHKNIGSVGAYVFPQATERAVQPVRDVNVDESTTVSNSNCGVGGESKDSQDRGSVPPLFRLAETRSVAQKIPSHVRQIPKVASERTQQMPISQWLFGQYNRLLPLVATARALVQAIAEADGPVRLSDASVRIAGDALVLGEYLSNADKKFSLPRDSATAIAFPYKRKGQQKAVLRFANQFVGDTTGSGQLIGMPASYQFLVRSVDSEDGVTITEQCLQFAVLQNPILDQARFTGTERLSSEQIDFLLDHVVDHVPAEQQAFEWLIKAIECGVSTPSELDELIISQPELMKSERPISDAFVSSQRSGAIARMCDLNLVKRLRDGVKARYAVTDRGQHYVTEL